MVEENDIPWLRETVDDDLAGVFIEDSEALARNIGRLIERLPNDPDLEARMIEALQHSVENQNDDTRGSIWISLVLGEMGIAAALPTLIQALALDADEELQVAAGVAVLKIGPAGIGALLEAIEEEGVAESLLEAAYQVLGSAGYLDDAVALQRVRDHLVEELEIENAASRPPAVIERIALAAARVGERRALPLIDRLLGEEPFRDRPAIQEAREMLEENASGAAISGDVIPGEEEYRWVFEYNADVYRPRKKDAPARPRKQASGPSEADLETFYRGLGSAPGEWPSPPDLPRTDDPG